MYGWSVKEQTASFYPLPATGRDVPTSEYYSESYGLSYRVSWKKLKWKETERIETREEV
jgi:hypothetical protein